MQIPESVTEAELRNRIDRSAVGLTALIERALEQAIKSHTGQLREDGQPYLTEHIYPVTTLTINFLANEVTEEFVASALLHDCIEDDASFTKAELRSIFGSHICEIVMSLSKPSVAGQFSETQKRQRVNGAYFKNLQSAPHEAKIIKLLDRIDNLHWAMTFGKELVTIYLDETKNFYLPFAKTVDARLYETITAQTLRLEAEAKAAGFIE
ncbi:MAG TPA: HD domain-containing protein [Candidatus Saccharimonadia bacterium]|nr:HD domain-containing protein [Candidatus Saccharimonadia bacterium]